MPDLEVDGMGNIERVPSEKVAGYVCSRCQRISHGPGGNCGHNEPKDAVPLVRATDYMGAVSREKIDAALDTVAYLHDISGGALDYLRATLLDPTGGQCDG